MGDSEDEHDRSRERDKFRRERSDYGSSEKGRSSRNDSHKDRRPTWREDRKRSREEHDGDNRRRSRGRDWSPPPPSKRPRRTEWDSLRDYSGPGMMAPYGLRPPWPMPPPPVPPMIPGIPRESPNSAPQTLSRQMMLTFKQFLLQQDDSIDEVDAIASYNEYKNDFKRKQVDEFFENHKDEDWFLSLYHPTNLARAKEENATHLSSRLGAFFFLMESGRLDAVSLSQEHIEEIVRVMDSAVIMMEGTEADLAALDMQEGEEEEGKKEGEVSTKGGPPSFMREPSEEDAKLAEQAKQYGLLKKIKQDNDVSDSDDSLVEEAAAPPPLPPPLPSSPMKEDLDMDRTPPLPDDDSTTGAASQDQEEVEAQENGTDRPRPLHLTHSVYIRHIPPKLSVEEIVKVCKTFPGFLRVAFAEAAADKGYERRGWVTYSHGTDIKSVCAQLVKVKDCLLSSCSVNRELTRRVKHRSPATWTRKAVHSDLHMAMELINFLDKKTDLWENSAACESGVKKCNPVLDIEESMLREEEEAESVAMATAEEEEGAISEISSTDVLDENNPKLKVLENLLWYLRLVHSLDYYNGLVFPFEDNMPHRCGIFTVRSKLPLSITPEDLATYCEEAKTRMEPLVAEKKLLSDEEMEKYGQKDPESEGEKFVEMNTQRISDSKYLCPLSGKKFKGPEFVKKHIFNKHVDKVEAVKKEAEFFNNYLRDCERPMPLEASIKSSMVPANPKTPSADESPTLGMISPLGGPPGMGGMWRPDAQMIMFGPGGGGSPKRFPPRGGYPDREFGRGGRRGRGPRRKQIDYKDLDAPEVIW